MRIRMRARRALESANNRNISSAEVMMSEQRRVSVEVQDNSIHVATEDYSEWMGIRTFKDHSLGFSAVNSLNPDRIESSIDEAVSIAGISPADESNILPEPQVIPWVKGLYDKELASISLNDSIGYGKAMLEACHNYDKRVSIDAASFIMTITNTAIASSTGIETSCRKSIVEYYLMGMARDGEEVSSFDIEYGATRNKSDIDVIKSANNLSERVIKSLGAKSGKSFKGQVILHGDAVMQMLLYPLLWSTSAENIQMGSSRFVGKRGKSVASFQLSIKDWGRSPGQPGSYPFDREGLPPKRIFPIRRGKFIEPYYNAKSAFRDKTISNGHAGGGASSTPGIESSNVIIKSGKESLDDIISDTKEGIIVGRFSGNVDPTSGDFSGAVKGGYLIENGKRTQPLLGTMIAGNIYEAIKNISGVSSETVQIGDCILPSFRLEGISVSSK